MVSWVAIRGGANPWSLYEFSKGEWTVIKQTWNTLVNDDKVIIGDKNCLIDNFQELLKELKIFDNKFA